MSDATAPEDGPAPERPEPEWQRRRRLARIFGDVLPETTRDERGADGRDGGRGDGERGSDAWLRSEVPPHHGS